MEKGFISLWREEIHQPYYTDIEYTHLWHTLLMLATYKDKVIEFNKETINLKRGQLVTSKRKLAQITGISNDSKVWRLLKQLEKDERIRINCDPQSEPQNDPQSEPPKKRNYTIITIVNYDVFQKMNQQVTHKVNTTNNINNIYYSNNLNIYDFLQDSFGRVIGGGECHKISEWEKDYHKSLIVYAILEAVNHNVKTMAYVDGILKNLKGKGYKEYKDIPKEKPVKKEIKEVFDYNWLDED